MKTFVCSYIFYRILILKLKMSNQIVNEFICRAKRGPPLVNFKILFLYFVNKTSLII